MKTALLQITGSDDPGENLSVVSDMLRQAAAAGAGFALTPEVTNCVSLSRSRQQAVLQHEEHDRTLSTLRALAADLGLWLSIGSLALRSDGNRFANRSFVIAPDGGIAARYDKIHMFDVTLSATESYRESAGFRPGDRAEICSTPFGTLGLSICYDLRFPALYRRLAQAGAGILLIPAAFAPQTGAAHWEPLLRARAIECGAYVLAAAQTGTHPAQHGASRVTHGHSMAVSPWGEILCDGGEAPGISYVTLNPQAVTRARRQMPSLSHDRAFRGPA